MLHISEEDYFFLESNIGNKCYMFIAGTFIAREETAISKTNNLRIKSLLKYLRIC